MNSFKPVSLVLPILLMACTPQTTSQADNTLSNSDVTSSESSYLSHVEDADAAKLARTMMQSIGGADRWATLTSMHISAIHTQPDLDEPYTSDVWRNVGQQQVRLVQEGTDFRDEHIYLDGRGWTIRNGETSDMHPNTAAFMESWNRNLLYAVLKDMGEGADTLSLTLTEDNILNVYRENQLSMVFEIDETGRFETFSTPSSDSESLSTSRVRVWGETEGYIYPLESETDAGAVFTAQSWIPSTQIIDITPPEGR